jgi:tRNA modification GTPase
MTATTMTHPDDTIVALSSAAGPGARAIVRLSGPTARAVVDALFVPHDSARRDRVSARYLQPGHLTLTGVHSPLPATLYFFPAPRTYTGQDLAELHTVSSPPLVERLIADLLAAGARPAQPGEFTLRAFLAGKKDLPQAEAVLAVIEAGTDADLKDALAQLAGGVTQPLAGLRDDLLNLLADVEAALDFVDEDIEFVTKTATLNRIAGGLAHLTNLRRQLDDRTVSGRVFRAVLVGEPNAGKSSLFNALVGTSAAIVSPTAGTTRDYLTARLTLSGVEVELIDTAGVQPALDAIDERSQALGRAEATRADIVLWCVPVTDAVDETLRVSIANTGAEVILVRTKADLSLVPPAPGGEGFGVRGTGEVLASTFIPDGVSPLRELLSEKAVAFARPPLAPSQSRCRHHVEAALDRLRAAHRHAVFDDPPELLALALRQALDQLGEMTGAIHTNDLLDRIFSRFCIGK